MPEERKHRRSDRRDGWWIRDVDPMHAVTPYITPNRTDNEAVLGELIDITQVNEYLEKKNANNPEFRYTWFHVICAAIAKTVILRPKMNYFISGHRMYERKKVELAFVVKKRFSDDASEALAKVVIDKNGKAPIEQFYEQVKAFVYDVRVKGNTEDITKKMDWFSKLPRWVFRIVIKILMKMEYYGRMPKAFSSGDPNYSSVFISNLGSIKMNADYHHLSNWGTNSFFVVIGEKHMHAYFKEDGSYDMREAIKLGITIDERIADGLYFANSLKILRYLLANPDLLELDANAPIDINHSDKKEKVGI